MGEFVWVELALSDSQKQGRYCDTATHPDLIYLASLMKKYMYRYIFNLQYVTI